MAQGRGRSAHQLRALVGGEHGIERGQPGKRDLGEGEPGGSTSEQIEQLAILGTRAGGAAGNGRQHRGEPVIDDDFAGYFSLFSGHREAA